MSGRLAAWLTLIGVFAALQYSFRATGGEPDRDVVYQWKLAAAALIQNAIVMIVLLAIAHGASARELFALRRPRSWLGALGYAALLLVVVYALSAALSPFLHPGEEQGLTPTGWDPDRAAPFAVNFAVIAGLVPVIEELTFRGLGYSLLRPFGRVVAVAGIGIAFGLVHGLVEALPILAVFGAGLALIRERTSSVIPCIVVHAAFNSIALAVSVTT